MSLDPTMTITTMETLSRSPAGVEGMVSGDLGNRVKTMAAAGARKEIKTLTLSNWSAGRNYVATINGVQITVTTPSGDTNVTGAAARLRDAINSDPRVRGQVAATSAAGVLTLTSLLAGMSFTLAGSTDAAAANVQSAALSPVVPLGCAMIYAGQAEVVSDSYSERLANERVQLPLAANMTARVVHVTPTSANSTLYGLAITLDTGEVYNIEITSGGSATVKAIVEAQVAAAPAALADIITVSDDDTKLILTAALAGRQFEVTAYGAGVQAISEATAGSDFNQLFAGFSAIDDTVTYVLTAEGRAAYPSATRLGVLAEGEIMCVNSEAVTPGAPIWIEGAAGVDLGRPFLTSSPTRWPLLPRRGAFQRRAASPSDNLVWVNVRR